MQRYTVYIAGLATTFVILTVLLTIGCDSEPPMVANGKASMAPSIEGYDDLRDMLEDLKPSPDVLIFLEATQDEDDDNDGDDDNDEDDDEDEDEGDEEGIIFLIWLNEGYTTDSFLNDFMACSVEYWVAEVHQSADIVSDISYTGLGTVMVSVDDTVLMTIDTYKLPVNGEVLTIFDLRGALIRLPFEGDDVQQGEAFSMMTEILDMMPNITRAATLDPYGEGWVIVL